MSGIGFLNSGMAVSKTPVYGVTRAGILRFTSEQFAKKLMSQIVFLYFIQKKGWLGVTAIPTRLTEKEYKNAFYKKGSRSRELIGRLYRKTAEDIYSLGKQEFMALDDETEEFFASIVIGKPWGTGPKTFMRKIFDGCIKKILHRNST